MLLRKLSKKWVGMVTYKKKNGKRWGVPKTPMKTLAIFEKIVGRYQKGSSNFEDIFRKYFPDPLVTQDISEIMGKY